MVFEQRDDRGKLKLVSFCVRRDATPFVVTCGTHLLVVTKRLVHQNSYSQEVLTGATQPTREKTLNISPRARNVPGRGKVEGEW